MLRRIFCYFGFHKWKKINANQYGYYEKCLICSKTDYTSYAVLTKLIGEPVDVALPFPGLNLNNYKTKKRQK